MLHNTIGAVIGFGLFVIYKTLKNGISFHSGKNNDHE